MRRALLLVLLGTFLVAGCRGGTNCASEADPLLERFRQMKLQTLRLLERRTDLERRRMLARAMAGEGEPSLPSTLQQTLEDMQRENVEITDKELAEREASFWQALDGMFASGDDILQGEIVFIEKDESTTAFRYPRKREVPAGLRWHGLRPQRTFCAYADCLVEAGTEPCLLIQIRPRDYSGSAGLTVGSSASTEGSSARSPQPTRSCRGSSTSNPGRGIP